MSIFVNTNSASLTAQLNLGRSNNALQTSLQRLSSGLRINSAADDAAGLAIAQGMTSQINGNNQAIRNANDGISLAQTADGALDSIQSNLQRIRDLAVQSSNASVSDSNRTQMQQEVDQLTQEISRAVQTTSFNGTALLSNTASLTFQVGAEGSASSQVSIDTTQMNLANSLATAGVGVATNAGALGLNTYDANLTATGTIDISTAANAFSNLAAMDLDIASISNVRSTVGAVQNRFTAVVSNLQNYVTNLASARSRIQDADFASETANFTRNQILQQAGNTILRQANSLPQAALSLLQ